jgi:phosphatidylinositol-3,4,5-trisphosphate 3-phosphatase/dual-specificity protein phosphatase PTEN
MNIVRTIVSGKKRRTKESNYNIDLTYITPRVMAMSFPGSGL